jgi:hypothetical protein
MAFSHGERKIKRQLKDGTIKRELNDTKAIPGDPYSSNDKLLMTIPDFWVNSCDKSAPEALLYYPEKQDWRKRFNYTLLKWSEGEGAIEILQFCKKYRIPYETIQNWFNTYDDIKTAYKQALLNLACNRRVGSINKVYDRESAYRDMHLYDQNWNAVNKYHAELSAKSGLNEGTTLKLVFDKPDIITEEEMSRRITSKKEKDCELAAQTEQDDK